MDDILGLIDQGDDPRDHFGHEQDGTDPECAGEPAKLLPIESRTVAKHLLPFFAAVPVTSITIALVDEYRSEKVIERERIKAAAAAGRPIRDKRGQRRVALSNESINKTLSWRTSSIPPSTTGCLRAIRRGASDGG